MATIRNLGECLCPRCTITKSKVPDLGTKRDDNRRTAGVRKDDGRFRRLVDTAWRAIYELGKGVKSAAVEALLAAESLVPTRVSLLYSSCQVMCRANNNLLGVQNAFSAFAQSVEAEMSSTFDFFSMFVPDLMHEFELGTWKATFTHLIRVLTAVGDDVVQQFNLR